MSKQFVRFCEVIDVIDTTDVDLIKVRLDPEDKAIEFEDTTENIDIININEAEKNIPIETDHYLYLS